MEKGNCSYGVMEHLYDIEQKEKQFAVPVE